MLSFWSKRGRTADTETRTCAASVLKVNVVLKEQGGPEKLDSAVNLRAVCKEFKQARTDVIYSRDAGRYHCDLAYYCSLYHGQRRAALIHVPSSFSLTPTDRLAPLLQSLIQTMLEQLEDPSQTAPRDDDSEVKTYDKERSRHINKTSCH